MDFDNLNNPSVVILALRTSILLFPIHSLPKSADMVLYSARLTDQVSSDVLHSHGMSK